VSDSGSIVVGWLGRLVVLFAALGLVAYDGFSIMVANFGAADDATVAASAAADEYRLHSDVRAAYDAATRAVAGKGDTVETKTFQIAADGRVTLTIDRRPSTLWVHRVGPLKKRTQVNPRGTGAPAS
jgi:hypothetical protein